MLLSPLALAVKHAPNLQFDSECEPEKKKELGLRALAFMDSKERDAIVLHAGLLLSSWTPSDIKLVPKAELKEDVDAIREVYLQHKPSKFHELRPVVARMSKEAMKRTHREASVYNNTITVTGTDCIGGDAASMTIAYQAYANTVRIVNATANCAVMVNTDWSNDAGHNNVVLASNTTSVYNNWITVNPTMTSIVDTYRSTSQIYYDSMTRSDGGAWGEASRLARSEQDRMRAPSKFHRKVIRRQIDLLGSVLDSPGDVHVFLRGEALTVQSETTGMKYRFTKHKSTTVKELTRGDSYTVPYHLEVLSPDDVYLTKMCVYVKETPMLDQLAAMMLYIKSGEDSSLIKTANFFSVGDADRLNAELRRLGLLEKQTGHIGNAQYVRLGSAVIGNQRSAEPVVVEVGVDIDRGDMMTRITTILNGTYEAVEEIECPNVIDEVRPTTTQLLSNALETIHMTPPPAPAKAQPTIALSDFPEVMAVREMLKDYHLLKLFSPT